MMTPQPKKIKPPLRNVLEKIALFAFGSLIIGYSIFAARHLISGPHMEVFSLSNGQVLADRLIVMEGRAKNAVYTSINDRPITIDTEGNFSESFLLPSGISIIKTLAKDRYGREEMKEIKVSVP